MRPIVTHIAWSVSLLVTSMSPANTDEPTQSCRLWRGLVGLKEPSIRWVPDLLQTKDTLWGGVMFGHAETCPAVNILNFIRKEAAAMWPLATRTVATCYDL